MTTGELDEQHARWEAERPSRCFDVARGVTWWTAVDVIEGVGVDVFGAAVRPMLESMYISVRSWPYRNPEALKRLLDGTEDLNSYVVLGVHSAADRLLFGTNDMSDSTLSWGANDLTAFLNLEGKIVLSVGCNSASPALVKAFLDGGAAAYIAPLAPPFAHSCAMFVSLVFYGLTQHLSLTDAVERAGRFHDELAMWRTFLP
jgi:hypothetical protein